MDKNSDENDLSPRGGCDTLRDLHEKLLRHEQILKTKSAKQESQFELLRSLVKCPEVDVAIPAWRPSAKSYTDTSIHNNVKSIASAKAASFDPASDLLNSWLRTFYVNHFKKVTFIRRLVMWAWRNGYPIYVNYLLVLFAYKQNKTCHSLVALCDFVTKKGILNYKLLGEEIFAPPQPDVCPISDQYYLNDSSSQYKFSGIFVANINSAIVYGGTNLTLVDGDVVCHDLYNFERDYTSEELHGRTLINSQKKCIKWLLYDDVPESVPLAASFVDACAINYAHWISEILPRIVLFCADDRFDGVPIVVNAGLHKNIMESLILVTGTKREILLLPIGRALAVDKLLLVSVTGYVPFDQRVKSVVGHSHGLFSPGAFGQLRRYMDVFLRQESAEIWPEKIFLRRNSGTRKLVNSVEIESFLVNFGYVIVEAEKLTFMQQIQLFSHARQIVAPTGAALVNAVFCKPDTRVIVLMSKHEKMIYRYWCNMLMPIQIKVAYILGSITQNCELGIHGDFSIEVDYLNNLLVRYEGEPQ